MPKRIGKVKRPVMIWPVLLALIALTTVLFPRTCFGDDLEVTAELEKQQILLDDSVVLTVRITGSAQSIEEPDIPEIEDMTVYSQGRSKNISIVNGKFTAFHEFTYLLTPQKKGSYRIGPVTVQYGGNQSRSKPLTLEVLSRASGSSHRERAKDRESAIPSSGRSRTPGKEIFITNTVDRDTAYVNEQLTMSFRLYRRINLWENPEYIPPELPGFWIEKLPQKRSFEVVDNKRYEVTEIATALFPTNPGEFTIDPARLRVVLETPSRDFFSFFNRGRPVDLETPPIDITVLPLPEKNKPEDFSGSVGSYTMNASVESKEVRMNEPLTLIIEVSGEGNIQTLPPDIAFPENDIFRLYDSKSGITTNVSGSRIRGKKTYERLIVPLEEGSLDIPSLSLDYFNPERGNYEKAVTRPIAIRVLSPLEGTGEEGDYPPYISQKEIKVLKKDIEYIVTTKNPLKNQTDFFVHSPYYFLLHLIPVIAFLAALQVKRHRDRISGDLNYVRRKKALKEATTILKKANRYIKSGDMERFSGEVSRSLNGYFAAKLNRSAAGLTGEQVRSLCEEQKMGKELVSLLADCYGTCDMAKFSGGAIEKQRIEELAKKAERLLAMAEKEFRKIR
jgi:hypothetical protein